jgi:hypothetical protein
MRHVHHGSSGLSYVCYPADGTGALGLSHVPLPCRQFLSGFKPVSRLTIGLEGAWFSGQVFSMPATFLSVLFQQGPFC